MSDEQKGEKLDEKGAAELTGDSPGEVAGAWHAARDDAADSGMLERGSGPGESHPQSQEVEAESLSGLQEAIAGTSPDTPDDPGK